MIVMEKTREIYWFFIVFFYSTFTYANNMTTSSLKQMLNVLIGQCEINVLFVENLVGLDLKQREDVSYDPFLNSPPSYEFYDSDAQDSNLFLKVSVKVPKLKVIGRSTVIFFLNPSTMPDWDYALSFGGDLLGELYSDAGGKLTSLKYLVDDKQVIFSKEVLSNSVERVTFVY